MSLCLATCRWTGGIDIMIFIIVIATYFKAGFMVFHVQRLQSGIVPFTSLLAPA